MAEFLGILDQLQQTFETDPDGRNLVGYNFVVGKDSLPLGSLLGQTIEIEFIGEKSCIHCGRRVRKLYQNGYCFPCVTTLAECDLCIVKPHECHYHLGTCREPAFGDTHCMIPHYVYLADSSSVKVGLTRKGRQLKRWADQGATSAILFAQTSTRKLAGELEMEIAQHLPDKTDWRKMLKDTGEADANLFEVREQVLSRLGPLYEPYVIQQPHEVVQFVYPRLLGFEPTLKSLSLDKQPSVRGTLCAIKGQYLMFEQGVLNIRKHAGFHVQISLSSVAVS